MAVLADVGYAALTMEDVAAAAGVSKATIYRRWRTKADLLVSVIDRASDVTLHLPDTGALRGDLVELLGSLARILSGPGGHASRALLGALNDEPALAEAFRTGPQARWAQAFIEVFDRAVQRGEVPAEAGISLAAEAGPGIIVLRWLLGYGAVDEEFAVSVVDGAMLPLLRRL